MPEAPEVRGEAGTDSPSEGPTLPSPGPQTLPSDCETMHLRCIGLPGPGRLLWQPQQTNTLSTQHWPGRLCQAEKEDSCKEFKIIIIYR